MRTIDELKPLIGKVFPDGVPVCLLQPCPCRFPGDPIYVMGPRRLDLLRTVDEYTKLHPIGNPVLIPNPTPPVPKPTQAERDAKAYPLPDAAAAVGITQEEWVAFARYGWNKHMEEMQPVSEAIFNWSMALATAMAEGRDPKDVPGVSVELPDGHKMKLGVHGQ